MLDRSKFISINVNILSVEVVSPFTCAAICIAINRAAYFLSFGLSIFFTLNQNYFPYLKPN